MTRLLLLSLLFLGVAPNACSFLTSPPSPPPSRTSFRPFPRKDSIATTILEESKVDDPTTTTGEAHHKIDNEELQRRIQSITAVSTDVDGTLLGSVNHALSEVTKNAIQMAVQEVSKPNGDGKLKYFFPATGKSRKGALDSLGAETRALLEDLPGVFLQGLYCVNGNGEVIFEKKLPEAAVVAAEQMADEFNTTIIANCGDIIYSNTAGHAKQLDEVNSLWGEPEPVIIESLAAYAAGTKVSFNKLVFMHDDVDMLHSELRPRLEALAEEVGATITTSFPTILEVLPEGCSKALGVQKLCDHLGISIGEELLALGDAENDKGMLEMAAIGVAMGNASPVAKMAADVIMKETSDEGAAGLAIERYSLLGSSTTADNNPVSPIFTVTYSRN